MTARFSRRPSRAMLPSRVPGHQWVQQWRPHKQQVDLHLYPSGALEAVGFVIETDCIGDRQRWYVSDGVVGMGTFVRTRKEAMRLLEDRILQPRHRLWDRLDDANGTRPWKWVCTDPESLCGKCQSAPGTCETLSWCNPFPWEHVVVRIPTSAACDPFDGGSDRMQRGCWTWGHPLPRAEAPATGFWQQAVRVDGNGRGAVRTYRVLDDDSFELSAPARAVIVFGPLFGPGVPTNVQLHLHYRGYRILQTVKAKDESEA